MRTIWKWETRKKGLSSPSFQYYAARKTRRSQIFSSHNRSFDSMLRVASKQHCSYNLYQTLGTTTWYTFYTLSVPTLTMHIGYTFQRKRRCGTGCKYIFVRFNSKPEVFRSNDSWWPFPVSLKMTLSRQNSPSFIQCSDDHKKRGSACSLIPRPTSQSSLEDISGKRCATGHVYFLPKMSQI